MPHGRMLLVSVVCNALLDRPPLDRHRLSHTFCHDMMHLYLTTGRALCALPTACYKLLAAAVAAGHN